MTGSWFRGDLLSAYTRISGDPLSVTGPRYINVNYLHQPIRIE